MWLATSLGYFSIVKKQGQFFVRVRNRKDLELLLTATGIEKDILEFAGTDYVARIIVNAKELELIQRTLFSTITYSNFKDSIASNKIQKDKKTYYTEMWGVMFDYQHRVGEPYKSVAQRVADEYDKEYNIFDKVEVRGYNKQSNGKKRKKR